MRTIRTKLYTFNELSDEAKQVAIEEYRSEDHVHLDFFHDDAVEQIEKAGFYGNVELQYSLSYCQGDGLSFGCDRIEESLLLSFFAEILGEGKEKTAKVIIDNCSFENTGNKGNHYCYASKGDVSYEFDDYYGKRYNVHEVVSQVEKKIENLYMELCKDLEKQGYSEIEYQRSDEAIIETILANGWEFLSNGKMY
jgi:hypothetical protein